MRAEHSFKEVYKSSLVSNSWLITQREFRTLIYPIVAMVKKYGIFNLRFFGDFFYRLAYTNGNKKNTVFLTYTLEFPLKKTLERLPSFGTFCIFP